MATSTGTSMSERSVKGRKARVEKPEPPSEEDIRVLAHELYERRCSDGVEGDAVADWVEAERLLRRE